MSAPKPFALLFCVLTLLAQQPASIQGLLTDASGAVIPAATILLSATNFQRAAQTGADGSYSFASIPPGEYTLKVDYPGLEASETRVAVDAGTRLQVPIQLRLRVSTQAVTIAGERGPELGLAADDSAAATVVKNSDLDALPDNPDDLRDMLQILAGNGAQIVVDGFGGGEVPAKNTIKEIKINNNRFAADIDWRWGGQVQVEIITKPGADKLHGSAGFSDSNAAFNSRNPYAANKADYVNRMYTANVGDSIKERASYTFNFYQNTINNTALIDAVTLDPATLAETPVRSTVVVPRSDISGTGRLDYQISMNHSFTGTYRNLNSQRSNNGVGQYSLESRGFSSENATSELRLRETAVLSGSTVSDTRFGYTHVANRQYGDTATPSLIVAGAFNGGSAQTGRTSDLNRLFEIRNDTTVVRKSHTMTFGGGLRYRGITNVAPSNFGGTFSFFGVTDAPVLDANHQPVGDETSQISSLEQYRRTLLFNNLHYPAALIRSLGGGASQYSIDTGDPRVSFGQMELGLYFQDEWRVRPNLTLTTGLRYQKQTNIRAWKDFAQRVSLAWSPGAKSGTPPKTVFRVGSGMFYSMIIPAVTQQALRFNGTTEQEYVVPNPDTYPAPPSVDLQAGGPSLSIYRVDPNARPSAWLLTSVTVERQLPGKTSLSVTYNDQRTTRMLLRANINAPLPDGTRPDGTAGNVFQFISGGFQKVKWLQSQVTNKANRRVSLTAQYTMMRAHNSGDDDGGTPANSYNFAEDWGRAGWNSGTHYINLFGNLTGPAGLEFSPFFIFTSGRPYDLTIGSDRNGDTIANDRPAFATDLTRPSVVVTQFGAFDTNPLPGQTIVPRNYLTGAPIWNINIRVSKTFGFGRPKEAPPAGYKGAAQHRYGINFNIDVNNILNHLNQGGYVGNLSSPLFGQSTAIGLFRDTSNNRRIQLGTQFTF